MFLLSGDGYVENFLRVASRVSSALLRLKEEGGATLVMLQWKGPHLSLRGESAAFSVRPETAGSSEVTTGNSGTRLCGLRNIQFPCELPGPSQRFLYIHCRGRESSHLELTPEPQCSSPVLTWISGFLWNFRREVRP